MTQHSSSPEDKITFSGSAGRGGLYIHIPYCASKCLYCDFYSGKFNIHDYERLTRALINECRERYDELPATLDTLYIGGGTPSMMPLQNLETLLTELHSVTGEKCWAGLKEVTIEANPDDVSYEKASGWAALGITRVSLGVQSFNDRLLRFMGRRHDSAQAVEAYSILRKHFDNISLDLMFGIPGQSLEDWVTTLDKIISLKPEHISCYALMYEAGTSLTRMRDSSMVTELPDELTEEMFVILHQKLREAGYEAYEISNFARHGKRSLHNSSYWAGTSYLGLGPSAHSYDGDNVRRWNRADIKSYLERFAPYESTSESDPNNPDNIARFNPGETLPIGMDMKKNVFYNTEILSPQERKDELILTRMRTSEGIDLREFATKFGDAARDRLLNNARVEISRELVENTGTNLRLTKKGILISDSVILTLSL